MNSEKLNELKKNIEKKTDELDREINHATVNLSESDVRHLKELKLQCSAQLRLIKFIESDFSDNDYIIC